MRAIAAVTVLLVAGCSAGPSSGASAGAIGFDDPPAPGAWLLESTGGAGPHASWQARADAAAVSAPNVMALVAPNHLSDDRFNLCWNPGLPFRDGRIAVAVRADGGEIDQGGGPMWRVRDPDNYYLCRWNPLESNFRVYVVTGGVRRQLATALVEGDRGGWHRIEVEHVGGRITCWFDGRQLLAANDATIDGPGGVGLWTKADARTSFDDLLVQASGG